MTIQTAVKRLAIATAGASVLAIGAHATPAEAARIFGFETNYEGTPITGSFTIDDTTVGQSLPFPFSFLDVSEYPDAISQADAKVGNQAFQFTDVDFFVGNNLLQSLSQLDPGLAQLLSLQFNVPDFDAIAFYNDSSNNSPFSNALAAVLFPNSLFSSTSLTAALDALDGAVGQAVAIDFNTFEFTDKTYEVRFFEKKSTTSVPEPGSIFTLLGVGALGVGAAYKRKRVTSL